MSTSAAEVQNFDSKYDAFKIMGIYTSGNCAHK